MHTSQSPWWVQDLQSRGSGDPGLNSYWLTSRYPGAVADDQRWGIAPSVASAALSFTTAYIHPRPQIRRLALLSGITSLLVGPITFAVGLPAINSQLLDLGTRSVKGQMTQADWSTKAAFVDRLIRDWESKHTIRFVSYVGGWAFSFAALLLAL
jgi:hypothetical protein